MHNDRLVYSTETGKVCRHCGRPVKKCVCKGKKAIKRTHPENDGILRIRREKKGRKGKTVTTISGFVEGPERLKPIAQSLKQKCGTGGSVKDGVIIIQGDHRTAVQTALQEQGFTIKLVGG